VNWLDAVIALAAFGAIYAGYRYGLAARALSWLGLALGILFGALFVADVTRAFQSSPTQTRLIVSIVFLFLMAVIGQALGVALGAVLRRHLPARTLLGPADRISGAAAGVFAVLVGVWMLLPALAHAPGWPARAAHGSVIVRAVDRFGPKPPHSLVKLGREVAEAPFPDVFNLHDRPDDPGPAPANGLAPAVAARVDRSVVKVEGRACDVIQQGSGFVVADDLIVTNAHVVAGETETRVVTTEGRTLDAVVVDFDPNRDLAVLRVAVLDLEVLERADAAAGDTGAVIGYPGGGSQQASPSRIAEEIQAQGTNIYGDAPTVRDVFVLAAALAPGDSGGALFDRRGRVVGMAFAVDPGDADTAYALARAEVEHVITHAGKAGASTPVSTGPCLVG
jgi:S1-C subfamily serine protease